MLKVSFEFFPPKTPEMETRLWSAVEQLSGFGPDFVSVTYGAGGTTRQRTHQTVKRIRDETHLTPAAHLTCVGASRAEVDDVARAYWNAGIRHIVALRGDPAQGCGAYVPHADGYRHASHLVRGLKAVGDFEISVAAFPEKHPESESFAQDIDALRAKEAAGAARAITQYFFGTDLFLRLRDAVEKAGIRLPLVPGLIPIGHFGQLRKFSAMCGASVPGWLAEKFAPLDDDPAARDARAIEFATLQARELLAHGVTHLHFYTLNRADLTGAVCRNLGLDAANGKKIC